MNIIPKDRYELLNYLPNGVTAEIGVATGRLSKIIIKNNNPKKLYLIDAWKNFDIGYYDENMVENNKHEQRYQDVTNYFKDNESVRIIRDMSSKAADNFKDNFFDWVYIDADHSYDGCMNDLVAFNNKVKPDGYIWGHDWLPEGQKRPGFNVNEAVLDFVEKNNYILSGITNERKFASYVISKTQDSHKKLIEVIDDV